MNLVVVPFYPAAFRLGTKRDKALVLFPDDERAFSSENVLLPPHLPQIASGDASPRVNRRLDLCQHDLIAEHTDAIRSREVEHVAVRMVQGRTRLDPVLSAHPASDLGLSSPAVIGVRVPTKAGTEQFVLGDGW